MWEYIHPVIVHFPIALWVATLFFYFLYAWRNDDFYFRSGRWLHILGVLGGIAAILSGERDEEKIEEVIEHISDAYELLERHETLGKITVGIFALLAIGVLWQRPKGSMRWLLVILTAIAVGILAYQGHLGGTIVYDYLIGNP